MKVLKLTAISLLPFLVLGCGEKEQSAINQNQLDGCGITGVSDENSSFTFRCGLNDDPQSHKAINVERKSFSKQQICNVSYSQSGVPEYFYCKDVPKTIDSFIAKGASLQGAWSCIGLDNSGNYSNKDKSRLLLKDNGVFEVHITAKKNTASVWFLTDSIISGNYTRDTTNKLRLEPNSWWSTLIEESGLAFEDAPKFMLVKPFEIEISNLTNSNLEGDGRWENDRSRIVGVECTKQ